MQPWEEQWPGHESQRSMPMEHHGGMTNQPASPGNSQSHNLCAGLAPSQ